METIELSFEFVKYSREYAEFILACNEVEPSAKIFNGGFKHWKTIRVPYTVLSVRVSKESAVILKLKFGNCLIEPPPRTEIIDMAESYNKPQFVDYISLCNNNNEAKIKTDDKLILTQLKTRNLL